MPSQPIRHLRPDDPAIMREIEAKEGRVLHMYRDSEGYVTVGVGQKIERALDATLLPFVRRNSQPVTPATREERAAEWERVHALPIYARASLYAAHTRLVLTNADVDALLRRRIAGFIDGLRGTFPDYDTYPYEAQLPLLDLAYNVGSVTAKNYPGLVGAVRRRDWVTAAAESHRRARSAATTRALEGRNEWTRTLFLQAATADSAAPKPRR